MTAQIARTKNSKRTFPCGTLDTAQTLWLSTIVNTNSDGFTIRWWNNASYLLSFWFERWWRENDANVMQKMNKRKENKNKLIGLKIEKNKMKTIKNVIDAWKPMTAQIARTKNSKRRFPCGTLDTTQTLLLSTILNTNFDGFKIWCWNNASYLLSS